MAAQWILILEGCLTVLVIVAFLCGQWPIFEGTFVQKINDFLTVGAYDLLLKAAIVFCGSKGRNVFLSVEHYFCDRPNPVLQTLDAHITYILPTTMENPPSCISNLLGSITFSQLG